MRQRVGFTIVNERLLMHGRIIARTPAEFADVIDENPRITTLALQNMTGDHDVEAAMILGRMVRSRGLGTLLQSDSDIGGAATAVFMAGRVRRMVEGARITVGNWSGAEPEYVREMLGSEAFYQFALRVEGSDPIHTMTTAEIAKYGLLTEPVKVWN